MRTPLSRFTILLPTLFLLTLASFAQLSQRGSIGGVVEASGAVLSNASGKLVDLQRNQTSSGVTESPYKPKDVENQFGGSLGGPIKIPGIWAARNKAFFFINVERWTVTRRNSFSGRQYPLLNERQGDFSD